MDGIKASTGVAVSLVLASLLATTASARVWADVYLSDEVTPLPLADPNVPHVYRDIMVGTRLAIFISSDTGGFWNGLIWLSPQDLAVGDVSGRDYSLESRRYEGSCLSALGSHSSVTLRTSSVGSRLDLFAWLDSIAGEWFVLDFEALGVGTCTPGLYAYGPSDPNSSDRSPEDADPPPFEVDLLQVLSFQHVLTRDYDQDHLVNFVDFAILADQWRVADVEEPNAAPALDLNADDWVDARDMALFSEYWLERTQAVAPGSDPNAAVAVP